MCGAHELTHDERRCHTPVERVLEVFVGDVEKPRIGRAADVVDEDVDAAEAIDRLTDDSLTVRTADGVGDDRVPLAAGLFDALDRCDDVGFRTCGADDGRSGLREDPRNALPTPFPAPVTMATCPSRLNCSQRHANPPSQLTAVNHNQRNEDQNRRELRRRRYPSEHGSGGQTLSARGQTAADAGATDGSRHRRVQAIGHGRGRCRVRSSPQPESPTAPSSSTFRPSSTCCWNWNNAKRRGSPNSSASTRIRSDNLSSILNEAVRLVVGLERRLGASAVQGLSRTALFTDTPHRREQRASGHRAGGSGDRARAARGHVASGREFR